MIHQRGYVKELLRKYIEGSATVAELTRLMAAWDIYDDDELSEMIAEINTAPVDVGMDNLNAEPLVKDQPASSFERLLKTLGRKWLAIFVCIMTIPIGYLWWKQVNKPDTPSLYCNEPCTNCDLPTGGYGCTVTFANKKKIIVNSSTPDGLIVRQGNMLILQPEPGVIELKTFGFISYKDTANKYIIFQTAAGEQYQVRLADGTSIRLNASSAISVAEGSKQKRFIVLAGEAFFDVAPYGAKPFYVKTKDAEMEIIKGVVNVKAYPGQGTMATVITGSMTIKSNEEKATLRSGKMVRVSAAEKDSLRINKVMKEAVVSWKKQVRIFNNAAMREYVTDMGRWYNLEIVSLGCVPEHTKISISICYNAPLEVVLQTFRKQGLVFRKEGNKITFCPPLAIAGNI